MKELDRTLLILGLFVLLGTGGCGGGSDSSGNSLTNPEPNYEPGDVVIIVDNQNPNAVPPPCGTEDAVCGTITDGLLSAAPVQDGVPTVLVKPGTYDTEPAYPLQFVVPVILKSEETLGATIRASDSYKTIEVLSLGVTIEGFTIMGGRIDVVEDGSVTIKESYVEGETRNPLCGVVISIDGSANIENSEIRSTIMASGDLLTLNNNTISSDCYGSASKQSEDERINVVMPPSPYLMYTILLYSGRGILDSNIINGNLQQKGAIQAEFNGNTIHGYMEVVGGRALFDNNVVISKDTYSSPQGISVDGGNINLTNNTLVAGNNYRPAFLLWNSSTAFISNNRFNPETRGIVIIQCEEDVTITTDGTNTLLNDCWISCNGLPSAPGSLPF